MVEKNAKEMVKTAVAALQDKKGEDIREKSCIEANR